MERKVLLITGGTRGIGAAVTRLAVARGYVVAASYRANDAAAAELTTAIEQAGGSCTAIKADIASEAEVVRLFADVDRRFGRVDALVNNAGIVDRLGRVEDIDEARLNRVFATNVNGAFLCAREAVRRMSTARGGRGGAIVNLSSRAARIGSANEYVHYAASKAAVEALTVGLAKEVALEGIRVNAVAAGLTKTAMQLDGGDPTRLPRLVPTIPMQRAGEPEEIAQAVVWLLSDEASYITGSIVDVSGGR